MAGPHEPARIRRPSNEKQWDAFLTKYASGELFDCNFVDRPIEENGASSVDSKLSQDEGVVSGGASSPVDVPSPVPSPESETKLSAPPSVIAGTSASTVTVTDQSIPTAKPPPRTPLTVAQNLSYLDENFSGTQTPPITDNHPNTSSSGPANQDPGIPNIENEADQNRGAPEREHMMKDEQPEGETAPNPAVLIETSPLVEGALAANTVAHEAAAYTEPPLHRRQSTQDRRKVRSAETVAAPRAGATPGSMFERKASAPISPLHSTSEMPRHDGMDGMDASSSSVSGRGSVEHAENLEADPAAERLRIREFYKENGYLPAPTQPAEATRRRLKAIRRLGLDKEGEDIHRATLDRFTRLACSIFDTKMSVVTIVGKDRQMFPSERGLNLRSLELEVGLCCHTVMTTNNHCMVVEDAATDWRFKKNPFVAEGLGPIQFYAGAPLILGTGRKQATIGTLCVIDDKPRHDFGDYGRAVLSDLAVCVVSELELLYQEQAAKWIAKMHQTSVDFQRRSLQVRAPIRPISRKRRNGSSGKSASTASTTSAERRGSADNNECVGGAEVNMYDEACREIRNTLDAYAVAVVDLSQFHMFYPAYGGSSTGTSNQGSTSTGGNSSAWFSSGLGSAPGSGSGASLGGWSAESEISMPYARPQDQSRARPTYHVTDNTIPQGRLPQVVFVPKRQSSNSKKTAHDRNHKDDLDVLGYSCGHDGFVFNFTSAPAARKIISDFIALNVRNRKVWYARDDSENVAASITQLMPPGTETSLAMPIYDFDGQVAFAIVACWTDPLFSYPSGGLAFVESIAGTLLASVMKEKLRLIERSQMMFATAASHETRTPLHQLLASAAALRIALGPTLSTPNSSPPLDTAVASQYSDFSESRDGVIGREARAEIAHQLDVIEGNGMALSGILENIVDTLDVGRLTPKRSRNTPSQGGADDEVLTEMVSLSDMLEEVMNEVMATNAKIRKVSGGQSFGVEAILEVLPRARGGWLLGRDDGPLRRALTKIIDNAFKFTTSGFVHVTVQDVTRNVVIDGGMDNSMSMSSIAINVRDSGCGMSAEFLETNLLQPFAKADPFSSGSGLGLGLAQRLIELLDGKLALQSTVGGGTTVQIEVPLRLMNRDHDSDLDNVEFNSEGEWEGDMPTAVRKDKIFLAGFADSPQAATRRVGKSLSRQLKRFEARITTDISEAGLVVATAEEEKSGHLVELIQAGQNDLQILVLSQDADARFTNVRRKTVELGGRTFELTDHTTTTIRRLPRFLSPSVVREIVRPLSPSVPSSPIRNRQDPQRPSLASVPFGDHGSSGTTIQPTQRQPAVPEHVTAPTSSVRPPPQHVAASDVMPVRQSPPKRPSMNRALSELLAAREETGQSDASSPPPTLRVLVVEDNAINRKILTGMLRKMGVHFAEAVDGVDAIEKFLTFRPGVVLLDINMPRKDGFEAATEMRGIERSQRRPRSTIVAVTAMSSELLKRRGIFECGIDAWRTKPVSIKDLKRDVETLSAGATIVS